jgi:hypothetical protein
VEGSLPAICTSSYQAVQLSRNDVWISSTLSVTEEHDSQLSAPKTTHLAKHELDKTLGPTPTEALEGTHLCLVQTLRRLYEVKWLFTGCPVVARKSAESANITSWFGTISKVFRTETGFSVVNVQFVCHARVTHQFL